MTISTLAWVTCREARGLDEDEDLALAALARRGVTVDVVDWDDPDVEWSLSKRCARSDPCFCLHESAWLF